MEERINTVWPFDSPINFAFRKVMARNKRPTNAVIIFDFKSSVALYSNVHQLKWKMEPGIPILL